MRIAKNITADTVISSAKLQAPSGNILVDLPEKGSLLFNNQDTALYCGTGSSWAETGGGLQDVGYVHVDCYNINAVTEHVIVNISPIPNTTQTSYSSWSASGTALCMPVGAGQNLQIFTDPTTLSAENLDDVIIQGNIWVSNPAGTEFVVCPFSIGGLNSSSPVQATTIITPSRRIGNDLQVVGGNEITSTAGGIFNISIFGAAFWA